MSIWAGTWGYLPARLAFMPAAAMRPWPLARVGGGAEGDTVAGVDAFHGGLSDTFKPVAKLR